MMSENDASGPTGLNAGQSLVARYREARLKQRPALQTDLRNDRAALRQSRLARLARQGPHTAAAAPPPPSPPAPHPAPPDGSLNPSGPSVFAQFIDHAAEQVLQAAPKPAPPPDPPRAAPSPAASAEPASAAPEPASAAPEPASAAPETPPPSLAAIGFGPGMVIRFRQLGVETAADLATADPASLRDALGDISRLINVEFWIESARSACATKAA